MEKHHQRRLSSAENSCSIQSSTTFRAVNLDISNTHYSNATGGVAMASRVEVGLSITPSCPAISAIALAMTFGGGGDGESRNAGRKEGAIK